MDTDKNYKLIDEVMNCSKADDWQNAKTEWQIVNYTDVELTEDDEHTCVCGKEGLKHLYTIQNTITKKTLFPIGSVCIKKFENEGLNSQLNYWKQLLQLKNAAVGYGKNNRIDFYKDKKKFSMKNVRESPYFNAGRDSTAPARLRGLFFVLFFFWIRLAIFFGIVNLVVDVLLHSFFAHVAHTTEIVTRAPQMPSPHF